MQKWQKYSIYSKTHIHDKMNRKKYAKVYLFYILKVYFKLKLSGIGCILNQYNSDQYVSNKYWYILLSEWVQFLILLNKNFKTNKE